MNQACPSCGASLAPGAERCDLCGTEVAAGAETADATADAAPAGRKSFCIACGHPNVPEARFCNRCGAALPDSAGTAAAGPARPADVPVAGPVMPPPGGAPSSDRPSSAAGARALWLVGLGLLVVVALYFLATRGGTDAPAPAPAPAAGAPPAPGLPPAAGPEPVVDPESVADLALPPDLQRDAEAAAALVAGAERANTAAAWDDAGRLYLDLTRRAAPEFRPALARQAIATFTRSLQVADDPDVRVRRVSAYRYDPATTMQPVTELQAVLAQDPNHAEANFQMGELRLQIGRADSAAASFDRAAAAAPAGGVLQRDALMMAERARQEAAAPTTPGPAGG
jgi:hypothetical protein